MKTSSILGVAFVAIALALLPCSLQAQEFELPGRDSSSPRTSPNGFVGQTIGTHDVHISYGRPFVKEREIFGGLVPFGEVWRAGANEATAMVFPVDVKIEGQDLPAGVYSFFVVPGEKEWTLVFNGQAKIWGTQHDEANDVLRVTVEPAEAPHAEMLSYRFDEVTNSAATVTLHWATTKASFGIAIAE